MKSLEDFKSVELTSADAIVGGGLEFNASLSDSFDNGPSDHHDNGPSDNHDNGPSECYDNGPSETHDAIQ